MIKQKIIAGSMVNQCPSCGEMFNSVDAFDRHRTGRFGVNRRCMTVVEMQHCGMVRNAGKLWVTALLPESVSFRKAS
jgi:hypothetical protein